MVVAETNEVVSKAHLALKSETANLENLAEWCQDNYFSDTDENKDRDDGEIQGGESLKTTAEYALKALQTVAYNVGVLAESFEAKLARLDQDLEATASEIGWLGLQVETNCERSARRQIRSLTVKKREEHSQPAVKQYKAFDEPIAVYVRKPVDYTVLDHVGFGGIRRGGKADRMSRTGSLMLDEPPYVIKIFKTLITYLHVKL